MDDLDAELEGACAKAAHTQALHEAEMKQAAAEVADLCRMLHETFPCLVQSADTNEEPLQPHLAFNAPDLLELQVHFPAPLASHSRVAVQTQ